ncbi:MAG TPA: hypothetical protein ENI87_07405 [bacterium]|nr:hypothetical protein [bacterium]
MRDDTGDTESAAPTPAEVRARWTSLDLLLLAAVTVAAAFVRLWSIEQWSFDAYEAVTWRAVTQPLDAFAASEQSRFPLVYLLLRWLIDAGVLPGVTEGWLRLPFAFVATLAVPLAAVLARPLLGRGVARLAATALAVHPLHVMFGQTATPVGIATTVVLAAGVVAMRRWWGSALLLVLLAGACHPAGWLAGAGLVVAAADRHGRLPALPRWLWLVLLLPATVLLPRLWIDAGPAVLLLALVTLWQRPSAVAGLSLAATLPLVGGAAWWWVDAQAATAAIVAALPTLLVLAAWSAVRFVAVVVERLQPTRVARLVAVAPAVMLLGELLTGTFLYFVVFAGGRPDWRAVQRAAIAHAIPGEDLRVAAGHGLDVLRTYLRSNHWRASRTDPHPGIHVDPFVDDDVAIARLLAAPGALLALDHDEYARLRARPELAAAFHTVGVWARPERHGDASVYLLQR